MAFEIFWWVEGDGLPPVADFLLNDVQEADRDKVIARINLFARYGLPKNPEQYKKLNGYDNLHELKSHQVRLLFFIDSKRLIFTEGWLKKQNKSDASRLDRADRCRLAFLRELTGGK